MNSLKDIGKLAVVVIVLISIVLLVSGKYQFSDEISFPFFSIIPKPTEGINSFTPTPSVSTPIVLITTTATPYEVLPNTENWYKEGEGVIEFADNYARIQSDDVAGIYTKNDRFHNLHVGLSVRVKRMESDGKYSLVMRRVDSCQMYNIQFSKIDDHNLKIEILKYFCETGYSLLNYTIVPVDVYDSNNISVSVEGGTVVRFSVKVNHVEALKMHDTNDFIWRGDFGIVVENSEIEFTDITLSEN